MLIKRFWWMKIFWLSFVMITLSADGILVPLWSINDSSHKLSRQITERGHQGTSLDLHYCAKILNQAFIWGVVVFWKEPVCYRSLSWFRSIWSEQPWGTRSSYDNTLFGNDFSREQDNDVNAARTAVTPWRYVCAWDCVAGCSDSVWLETCQSFNQFN